MFGRLQLVWDAMQGAHFSDMIVCAFVQHQSRKTYTLPSITSNADSVMARQPTYFTMAAIAEAMKTLQVTFMIC